MVFLAFTAALVLFLLVALALGLGFDFAERTGLLVRTLAAFLARALPAGERLVAGLRRVDLLATTRLRDVEPVDEWREEERDVSFFALLAMGLLMRKALDSKTIHHKDRRKTRRELNIADDLIQRKSRVCGSRLAL